MSMKPEEVRFIVHETLVGLGFTVSDPNMMQQDMIYLRQFREGSQAFRRNIAKIFVSVSLPAFLFLLWDTFKHAVMK